MKSIKVIREAFPDTPWIYVYWEPVQVMMSRIGQCDPKHAMCTSAMSRPPKMFKDLVRKNNKQLIDLSAEECCAAHLVSGLQIDDAYLLPINKCLYLIHTYLYT